MSTGDNDNPYQPNQPANPYQAPAASMAADSSAAGNVGSARAVPVGNAVDWWSAGWQLFKANAGAMIGAIVVFFLLSLAIGIIPFLGILGLLLQTILLGGLYIGLREADSGGTFQFRHLFAGFERNTGQLVMVGLIFLIGVIVVAVVAGLLGAMIGLGAIFSPRAAVGAGSLLFLLFVLAVVLAATMFYLYAPWLVALHDVKAIDAMKMSFAACLKNWLPLLIFGLIWIVLAIIAAIPFGLGFLVLAPVAIAALYASARDIFRS